MPGLEANKYLSNDLMNVFQMVLESIYCKRKSLDHIQSHWIVDIALATEESDKALL